MPSRYDWYVRSGDTIHGPFPDLQIAAFAREGKISPATQLAFCAPGEMPLDWHAAKRVKGLQFETVDKASQAVPSEDDAESLEDKFLRRNHRYLLIAIFGGLILFVPLAGWAIWMRSGAEGDTARSNPTNEQVVRRVEEFVTDFLVSPRSATFSNADVKPIRDIDEGEYGWWVSGHVESQNRLGVFLREEYLACVHYRATSDEWVFECLDIGDTPVYESPKLEAAYYNLEVEMDAVEKPRPRTDGVNAGQCAFAGSKLDAWNMARRKAVNYAGEQVPIRPTKSRLEKSDVWGYEIWYFETTVDREHPTLGWHRKPVEIEVYLSDSPWAFKFDLGKWEPITTPQGQPMRGPD